MPHTIVAPVPEAETVHYDLHGVKYSSCIHDDVTIVHRHGQGRDLTNQQPCAVTLSDGTWMMCWTQATEEAAKDESVVGAVSRDGGKTWSAPFFIEESIGERTASWGMLFAVPHNSRVYCIYWFNENAFWLRDAGSLYFRFTDDRGATWSERHRITIPRHALDVEGEEQHGWNTGFPILTADGAMLLGFSKIHPPSMTRDEPGHMYGDPDFWHSESFFLRCPNVLNEDNPAKLEFQVTPEGPVGLWAPHVERPEQHFAQEPYMAILPTGRIIATMRTRTLHPCYSVSDDNGVSWTQAVPLRFTPGGEKMKHPAGPCPITATPDGRVIFLFRNDNAPVGERHLAYWRNRDPIHVTVGREMPLTARGLPPEEANAGLVFNAPKVLLSGINIGADQHKPYRTAQYAQLLHWAGRFFAVYSSEKTDMVVKEVPGEMVG